MKTSEIVIILIVGTLTLMVFVFFVILIVIEYRRRQVKHITEKLELEHLYKQEVLQTQLEVQEQSFKYVSEEIHDNIAQTLSLARIKLYKAVDKAADEKAKASLQTTTELVGNALDGLRGLSHVLNGGLVSKLTLQESLEKELRYVHEVNERTTELIVTGDVYEPDAEKKLMLFRIVQEAINNAVKHGKASKIAVRLAYEPGRIKVEVTDNGKGFDVATVADSKGLGMTNMHVRAQLLGDINVESVEGSGTTITINVITNE